MKVLLTTLSLDPRLGGGTTERTRKLAKYLRLAGADVRVTSIENGTVAEELRKQGIKTHVTGSMRLRYTIPFGSPVAIMRQVDWADHIHILGHWNLLSVATAYCARWRGKPYVFCAAGEFAGPSHFGTAARLFQQGVGLPMVRNAARLISITDLERQQILARFARPPEEVITIENGVEDVDSSGAAPVGSLPDGPYLLFLGRLASIKGPDLLIDAFARIVPDFPDLSLVMAGPDFGLEASLRSAAERPPLTSRVVFPGFLDEAQRTTALRNALALVVPSRNEAMSLVAIEAGMQGLPVVVTDSCGLSVVAGIDGGEVCPATVDGLDEALRRLMTANNRKEKGQRWRRHVMEHYQWPRLADQLLTVFEGIRR